MPSTIVVGFVLLLAACTQPLGQAQTSPSDSPSAAASPTASASAAPADSPSPDASPPTSASPSSAKLIITSVPFHMGEVGLSYGTVTLGAAGGVKPYKWSISSGGLPPGLAVSSGGSTTGKPTTAGTFSFVIRVDDSAGAAAGVSRSILVFRQIAFATGIPPCTGYAISGCTTTVKYTGGIPNGTPTVKVTDTGKPPLPPGSTFTAAKGVVSVSIAGSNCGSAYGNGYSSVVTLVLEDQSSCGAGFNCSSGKLSLTIRLLTC